MKKFKEQKTDEEIFYTLIVIKRYHKNINFEELSELVKESRFKNRKARYLLNMKDQFKNVLDILKISFINIGAKDGKKSN